MVAGGDAREQQGELAPSEFDFGFSFKGEGKRLSEFPELCAEYLSSIKSGDKFEVDLSAEDLFSEKVYSSWAQQTVQMIASTNHMAQHFDHCLKKACEQLEKKNKRLERSKRTIDVHKETIESLESRYAAREKELAEERAANAALKSKLKDEKARLRSSRAFEVAKERRLTEERMESRVEAKLGKLKYYFDAMERVYAKQTYLNQATCLKEIYEAEEKGVLISSEQKEVIENDLKTLPEEIKEIELVKIVPSDFEMTPDEDRMPAEQWVPPSPISEGSSSPHAFVDETDGSQDGDVDGVDDQTGEPLLPLYPPTNPPEQPPRPSS